MKKSSVNSARKKKVKKSTSKLTNKSRGPLGSVILFSIALILFFLVIVPGENIWLWTHNFIFGLFGVCSILWPILLLCVSVLDSLGKTGPSIKSKLIMSSVTIIFCCSLFYVFSLKTSQGDFTERFNYILDQYK